MNFFFLRVVCGYFFEFFLFRFVVVIVVFVVVVIVVGQVYSFGDDSEHSSARKCLPMFDRMSRQYDVVCIFDIVLFPIFFFFSRFAGLIAEI